jgi:hypothetical protein
VSTIEEGIEILSGIAAGGTPDEKGLARRDGAYPAESVFGRVAARLDAMRQPDETKTGDENDKKPARDTNGDEGST